MKFIKLEIQLTNMEFLGTVRKTNVHELMNTQYLTIAANNPNYTYTFNLSKVRAKDNYIIKSFKVGESIKLYSKKEKKQLTCSLEQFMKLFNAKEHIENNIVAKENIELEL